MSTKRGFLFVGVVLASRGYPDSSESNQPISGIEDAQREAAVSVYHAGTAMRDGHLVTAGIEAHVAHLDDIAVRDCRGILAAAASQRRAYPRDEFAQPERLGDVVVGTDLEAHHSVDLGTFRRDHDDRNLGLLSELPTDVDAADLRQHHVEENEIGLRRVEEFQGLSAVDCDDDVEARVLECPGRMLT